MRPLDRLLLILDRTMVLFIGLAVGAVVTLSFFTGGEPGSQARASIPAMPRDRERGHESDQQAGGRSDDAASGDGGGGGPADRDRRVRRQLRRRHLGGPLQQAADRDSASRSTSYAERSTGFTRYRSLNLLDDIRAKLDRQPVDIAVISFGANDTQGIFDQGHGNAYMSEGWQRIVTERVSAVVQLLRDRGVMVYWVGLPKMRDPHFDADIQAMNQFYARADGGARRALYRDLPVERRRQRPICALSSRRAARR